MKDEIRRGTAKRHISLPFLLYSSGFILLLSPSFAQQVRRAVPVDQDQNIPTAPAVPFEPFESPTPHPASPFATPATRFPAPTINEEPVPSPAQPAPASEDSADQVQLDFANGFYSRGLVDMAAPEYEKYLNLYPNAPVMERERQPRVEEEHERAEGRSLRGEQAVLGGALTVLRGAHDDLDTEVGPARGLLIRGVALRHL